MSPEGPAGDAWEGIASPNVMGESEEAVIRSLSTHEPDGPEEKELLFLWKCGYRWPLANSGTEHSKDSPPGPPLGRLVAFLGGRLGHGGRWQVEDHAGAGCAG